MGKEKLKKHALERLAKNDPDAMQALAEAMGMTPSEIIEKVKLIDVHRPTPRSEGGTYEDPANVTVITPVEHLKRHDNFRKRTPEMEELKALVDDRNQVVRMANTIRNRLLAYERRTDHADPDIKLHLEQQLGFTERELANRTRKLENAVLALGDPLVNAALGVPGIGPVTVAYCLVYFDLGGIFPDTIIDKDGNEKPHPKAGKEKCPHASSLWSYLGLDKPSHLRYTAGEAGGGNKTLRTVLKTMADAQVKFNGEPDKHGNPRIKGAYHDIYRQVKARLEVSDVVTESRRTGQKGVHKVAWKDDKPSHRHGAAQRAVIKHFVADWWFVGRDLLGLPNGPCYAQAILGKSHRTIDPKSRGWVWNSPAKAATAPQKPETASEKGVEEAAA